MVMLSLIQIRILFALLATWDNHRIMILWFYLGAVLAHTQTAVDQHPQLSSHACSVAWGCCDTVHDPSSTQLIDPAFLDPSAMPSHPQTDQLNLMSSANIWSTHLFPSSRLSMMTLHWGTPLMTTCPLYSNPFTSSLWAWPSINTITVLSNIKYQLELIVISLLFYRSSGNY